MVLGCIGTVKECANSYVHYETLSILIVILIIVLFILINYGRKKTELNE